MWSVQPSLWTVDHRWARFCTRFNSIFRVVENEALLAHCQANLLLMLLMPLLSDVVQLEGDAYFVRISATDSISKKNRHFDLGRLTMRLVSFWDRWSGSWCAIHFGNPLACMSRPPMRVWYMAGTFYFGVLLRGWKRCSTRRRKKMCSTWVSERVFYWGWKKEKTMGKDAQPIKWSAGYDKVDCQPCYKSNTLMIRVWPQGDHQAAPAVMWGRH